MVEEAVGMVGGSPRRYGLPAQCDKSPDRRRNLVPLGRSDRYDTAARVATTLFSLAPDAFGAALGTNFPDALAGGADAGLANIPLLLVTTSAPLPPATAAYLGTVKPTTGLLYGGTTAVDDTTLTALENA
jgi:hypothetical protein